MVVVCCWARLLTRRGRAYFGPQIRARLPDRCHRGFSSYAIMLSVPLHSPLYRLSLFPSRPLLHSEVVNQNRGQTLWVIYTFIRAPSGPQPNSRRIALHYPRAVLCMKVSFQYRHPPTVGIQYPATREGHFDGELGITIRALWSCALELARAGPSDVQRGMLRRGGVGGVGGARWWRVARSCVKYQASKSPMASRVSAHWPLGRLHWIPVRFIREAR